jgi:hypothetical protein
MLYSATELDTDKAQESLDRALEPLRERLAAHSIYGLLRDSRTVHLFMEAHVFAVWDFQSLLKALQRLVTCVEIPWYPTDDPEARRLVNEIVLDEESDQAPGGGYLSHFELYLEAMLECGANTEPVRAFMRSLRAGTDLKEALRMSTVPSGVQPFVDVTMEIATSGQVHRIAAAFAFGREEVIPVMFRHFVGSLSKASPSSWATFRHYLDLHIGTDSEVHGPQAKRLVAKLCGKDPVLWAEATESAQRSLRARLDLWDKVAASLA